MHAWLIKFYQETDIMNESEEKFMKKTILFTLLLILFLLPANFSQAAELTEINEQNFPSQALRDFAGKIDQNGDGKLSLEERNCVTEVSVMCGELDETLIQKQEYSFAAIISTVNNKDVNAGEHMKEGQKLSLKGIEYFGQLKILGYRYTQGSLLKNKNLTDLFIGDDKQVDTHAPKRTDEAFAFGKEEWKQFKERMPLPQIKNLCFGCGYHFDTLSLKEAVNLEKLQFGCPDKETVFCEPFQITEIKKLDLSANKNLKSLILRDTETEVLDLRKNKKLEKLIISGKYKRQDYLTPIKDIHKKRKLTSSDVKKLQEDYRKRKVGKKYAMYEGDILSDKKNPLVEVTYATKKSLDIKKIKVAKDNKIRHLEFTVSKKVPDLSDFQSLKYLQVKGGEKIRISKKTYERYLKKKLSFYVRGSRTKFQNIKVVRNKVSVQAPLLRDRSWLYNPFAWDQADPFRMMN